MTAYLIILLVFGLMIGALFRPIMGVICYLFIYMIYNPDMWWAVKFSPYIGRLSFFAMFFLALGSTFHFKALSLTPTPREWLFLLFLGTAWIISLFFGVYVHELSWVYLEKLTKTFIFIFFFVRVIHTMEDYNLVAWTFIIGGIFLSYQAHIIGIYNEGRLDNIGGIDFSEANSFAAFVVFCIAILGFKLLKFIWWKKLIVIPAIALLINAVILTQSRAVFIGVSIALLFVVISTSAQYRKQILFYAALALILLLILADVKFWQRIGTIDNEAGRIGHVKQFNQNEQLSRIDFWKASLKIFKDHPLGIGVKNFELVVPQYDPRNPGMDAHNTYVLTYSELGIFGIAQFLIIAISGWRQVSRVRRMAEGAGHKKKIWLHAITLQTVMIIYFFGPMITHSYLYSEFLWIILALPICLEKSSSKVIEEYQKHKGSTLRKGGIGLTPKRG